MPACNGPFTLMRGTTQLMAGDFGLVAVVFHRLNGSAPHARQSRDVAAAGPGVTGTLLLAGDTIRFLHHGHEVARYVIGDPAGAQVTESTAFDLFLARVAAEMGVDDVAPGPFLSKFRGGMSPADAVLSDRLECAVLER